MLYLLEIHLLMSKAKVSFIIVGFYEYVVS